MESKEISAFRKALVDTVMAVFPLLCTIGLGKQYSHLAEPPFLALKVLLQSGWTVVGQED